MFRLTSQGYGRLRKPENNPSETLLLNCPLDGEAYGMTPELTGMGETSALPLISCYVYFSLEY